MALYLFSGTCISSTDTEAGHSTVILTCNEFTVIKGYAFLCLAPQDFNNGVCFNNIWCSQGSTQMFKCKIVCRRICWYIFNMYTMFLSISVSYYLEDPPTYCVFIACFGNPKGTMSKKRQNVKDVLYNWQWDGKRCCTTRDLLPLVWNGGAGVEWK